MPCSSSANATRTFQYATVCTSISDVLAFSTTWPLFCSHEQNDKLVLSVQEKMPQTLLIKNYGTVV